MRRLHFFVVPLCFLSGQTSPLQSQEKKQPGAQAAEVAGRSLEYWTSQIPSKDQSKSENAIRTVLLFGPDRAYQAVPAILDRLRKHNPPNAPVDLSVRVHGAIALGLILGGHKEAEQKVTRDAVSILKKSLTDSQSILRYRAAEALGRIGIEARDAIPELIGMVKDTSTWETRQQAAIALGQIAQDRINGPSAAVLGALYKALNDGSVQVRLAAIQALTALGGPVDPNLKIGLVKALDPVAYKDTEPSVSIWAHMAIMSITRNIDKDRVEAIARHVANPDVAGRTQALQALGSIGKDAKATIPVIIKALQDPDPTVITWSMWALGQMGSAAAGALPVLERIKTDMTQTEVVRKLAEDAIERINGKKS